VGAEEVAADFVLTDNLVRYGPYGVFGDGHAAGMNTISGFLPGSTITANGVACIAGSSRCSASNYPAGNVFLAEADWQAQFVDFANGDYRLASDSQFVGAGTDGKALGVDLDAVAAASGSAPAPVTPRAPAKPTNVRVR
jgi:hypothetical protein